MKAMTVLAVAVIPLALLAGCGSVSEPVVEQGSANVSAEQPPHAPPAGAPTASATGSMRSPSPRETPALISAIQVPSCEHASGAYRITLPDGWWTNPAFQDAELGHVSACRFFAPTTFDVTDGDRETPIPTGAAIWMDFLDGGCVGYINPILTSRETTVGGYDAVASTLAAGKEEAGPEFTYEYVVTLTADPNCEIDGQYVYALTRRDLAGAYEDNKAALDQLMRTIVIRVP